MTALLLLPALGWAPPCLPLLPLSRAAPSLLPAALPCRTGRAGAIVASAKDSARALATPTAGTMAAPGPPDLDEDEDLTVSSQTLAVLLLCCAIGAVCALDRVLISIAILRKQVAQLV